ncbi:hypothetical protein [Kosakonia sp. MUSA4]|uniref:hypothetical protein n=1 Tax=Kosakonia sp. MUSA4 TaxID=2067958 RepID=UPI001ABF68A7|nr:hypothetical protein [Kosakonia sp. MUSA4]
MANVEVSIKIDSNGNAEFRFRHAGQSKWTKVHIVHIGAVGTPTGDADFFGRVGKSLDK